MRFIAKTIQVSDSLGAVSAIAGEPEKEMKAMLVLGHGAGANMNHAFMLSLAEALGAMGIGTLRYNFPYMEHKKARPDPPAIAEKTVSAAIAFAHQAYPDVPLWAGGKSFGGRMTSQYLARETPRFVEGIIFFGFPLHPTGKPSTDRTKHLSAIQVPMLFLQGTRDALAEIHLIEHVVDVLPMATLHKFEGVDHSFKAGKRDMIAALAESATAFILPA